MDVLDCLIVGTGMSAIAAASRLLKAGHAILMVDKSRGVGGRLATRRMDGAILDHGAQFFTIRSEAFEKFCTPYIQQGVLKQWPTSGKEGGSAPENIFPLANPDRGSSAEALPKYIAAAGMTGWVKTIFQEWQAFYGDRFQYALNQRVVQLEAVHNQTEGSTQETLSPSFIWKVSTEQGEHWLARQVLLTAPVPQCMALLNESVFEAHTYQQLKPQLEQVAYDPCLVLLVKDTQPQPDLLKAFPPGYWDAVSLSQDLPLSWVANNQLKGISPHACCWTLHASGAWSKKHWELPDEQLIPMMIEAFEALVGMPTGWCSSNFEGELQLKRWRYAKVSKPWGELYPTPADSLPAKNSLGTTGVIFSEVPLGMLAGDGFAGARVEGAFLSGIDAAERLLTAERLVSLT